jgi:hypothetical protein
MRNTGGVLHPWQAAAYTRDRSTTVTPDLGLTSLDLGSQADTKDMIFGIGRQPPTSKMGHFCLIQRVLDLVADTKDLLPAVTKNYFVVVVPLPH